MLFRSDNFNAPYFAKSVKDFWRRWHISLTGWFRDYLYIPLGGNRKGKFRTECNLLLVFALSGLWHGSAVSYIVWGLLNGIYQVIGDVVRKKTKWENEFGKNLLRRIAVFLLISFAWLFFRAGGVRPALTLLRDMMHFNWTILFDGSLYLLGVPEGYFRVLCYAIILLFLVDYKKYIGINLVERFMGLCWWVRLTAESILLFTIFLYGCYGELYDTTQFIYFQF